MDEENGFQYIRIVAMQKALKIWNEYLIEPKISPIMLHNSWLCQITRSRGFANYFLLKYWILRHLIQFSHIVARKDWIRSFKHIVLQLKKRLEKRLDSLQVFGWFHFVRSVGHGFFGRRHPPMFVVQKFLCSIHHGHDLTGDTVDSSEISAKLIICELLQEFWTINSIITLFICGTWCSISDCENLAGKKIHNSGIYMHPNMLFVPKTTWGWHFSNSVNTAGQKPKIPVVKMDIFWHFKKRRSVTTQAGKCQTS